MGLLDQLGGMLQQYSGSNSPAPSAQATEHFEQAAAQAPQSSLASALSGVFRSPETGTFGQNISQLFNQSNPQQRAGILNQLLPYAGTLGLGGISSILGRGTSSGGTGMVPQVNEDLAQQVPPQAVEELANHAQQQNPSIVDQAGQFYSQHPTLVKALGATAAVMALRHLASAEQG